MTTANIELKDFDTLFVSGHLTTPFCISWSPDDKIALIVEDGVQIYEFYPTPQSDQLTITFLRSWIPVNTSLPFQNVLIDNRTNNYVWNLSMKEVYDMALDSTLSSLIEKSAIASYVSQCSFSPLIFNESYISCLTNNGVLEIYKWDIQKWKSVLNISNLWIKHCLTEESTNHIHYELLKSKIFQMKIVCMTWSDQPKLSFVTGHEDGGICLWDVKTEHERMTMSVNQYFKVGGKPCYLTQLEKTESGICFLLIGMLQGTVKLISFELIDQKDVGKIVTESDLWKHEDQMKPNYIKVEKINGEFNCFIVKNHMLVVQRIEVGSKSCVSVLETSWYDFKAPVISFDNYGDGFIVGNRNHEFFTLRVNQDGLDVKKNVDFTLKPKQTACFYCYGLAMSRNKAIWIKATSAKVHYDTKTMRDTIRLLIFIPKLKLFNSLTDVTCADLIKKIIEDQPTTNLTMISDLLELKKCEILADPAALMENPECEPNSSLLELKVTIWESKLKIFTQSMEIQHVISSCEWLICKEWVVRRVAELTNSKFELSPLQAKSLDVMMAFLNNSDKDNASGKCAICSGSVSFDNVRFSTCSNSHTFPRCSLSLLPCDSVPYAFCRMCDSVAIPEFLPDNDYRCLYCDGLLVPDTRVKKIKPSEPE